MSVECQGINDEALNVCKAGERLRLEGRALSAVNLERRQFRKMLEDAKTANCRSVLS